MNAQCPSCKARYRVKLESIPDDGISVLYPKCKTRFSIRPEYQTLKEEPPLQNGQRFEQEIIGDNLEEEGRQGVRGLIKGT